VLAITAPIKTNIPHTAKKINTYFSSVSSFQ